MRLMTRPLAGLLLSLGLCPMAFAEQADTAQTADIPQTLVKIDDFAITNLHFALFASQTGRNPADAAGQISLLNELVNHFMVANSAQGRALAEDPDVVAAMEVARARLIAQTFVRTQLESSPVDEAQIKALYDSRYANASNREYKARHILLTSEEDAKAVISELDAGADFAALATERSTGPSKSQGGDLGWFESDQMVADFASATEQLADGSYSKTPVKTRFGWHVILREDSRDVAPPVLDSVHDELKKELQQARIAEAITAIRDNTRIEVQSPDQ